MLEIPVSLFPVKDTFHIGDTIQVTSAFSDEIYDRNSNRFYRIKNQNFFPGTYIVRIDVTPTYYILDEFDWLVGEEFEYTPLSASDMTKGYVGEYNYSEITGMYQLSFGFIPRQAGIYFFQHVTSLSLSVSSLPTIPGLCDRKDILTYNKLNAEEDGNIELLLESPDEFYNTRKYQRSSEFHQAAGFVFVVKE